MHKPPKPLIKPAHPPLRPARPAGLVVGAPAAPVPEIKNILPGQWFFGSSGTLKTLLGSCVAVTLWHPQRGIGGMCHYLLPGRVRRAGEPLDGRFGDEALELLVQQIQRHGTHPADYHAHLYGGADTLPDAMNVKFNVGERNIEQGWQLLDQHGFQLQGVDVGETVPRTVTLQLPQGLVTMTRGKCVNQK